MGLGEIELGEEEIRIPMSDHNLFDQSSLSKGEHSNTFGFEGSQPTWQSFFCGKGEKGPHKWRMP